MPILRTKLHIPHRSSTLVIRPRLLELLKPGLNKPLTILSAPAGFGKTTLVSEWLNNRADRVAWVSLDKQDNNRQCGKSCVNKVKINPPWRELG